MKKGKKGLKVFYGLRKLTNKMVKKPSIMVVFENAYSPKNQMLIERKMKVLHTRLQTEKEEKDALLSNRMFLIYELFFLSRKYKGNPENAILANYNADSNNVSERERKEIAEKLRSNVYSFYAIKKKQELQLQLQF